MSRFFAIAALVFSLAAPAAAQQTPANGVYTAEQATAGQAVYRAQCSGCHGPTLGGNAGPSLRGENFLKNWAGKSLDELAVKIQNTMPQNAPGKLTRDQAVTLVAYMLQAGKFPAGKDALTDEASIKQVMFPGGAPAVGAGGFGGGAGARDAADGQPRPDHARDPLSELEHHLQRAGAGSRRAEAAVQTGLGRASTGPTGARASTRAGSWSTTRRSPSRTSRRCCSSRAGARTAAPCRWSATTG